MGENNLDGKIQETDEDRKPLGEPYNPNDEGGEDLPHRLSGLPTVNVDAAATPAQPDVFDDYIHTGDGGITHPSAYHTGYDTAEACGVDISDAEDDGMDGM